MRNREDSSRFWDKTHAPRAAGPGQLRLRQRRAERRNPAAAPAKTEGNGKKKECVCTGKAHPGSLPPHAPRLSLFYEVITSAISQRGNAAAPGAMLGPAPWLWCWDQCPSCGAGTSAPVVPCQQPGKENKLPNLSKLSKRGWCTEGSPAPGPPRGTAGREFGPCSLVLRPRARCIPPLSVPKSLAWEAASPRSRPAFR